MKRLLILLLCMFMVGCSPAEKTSFDGKNRPSVCGSLKVTENKLTDADGNEVMLRGISSNGISLSHMFINEDTFHEISSFIGANVMRLSLYTWGVGSAGYCTGGDKQALLKDVETGIELCQKEDMYALVDWHVLEDRDPNVYKDDAIEFFDYISAKYADYDNLIYEICNEPNHCEWQDIKAYAEAVIPVIRKNDPDSLIIVGTPNWSQDVDTAADDPLEYDNLMYSLHFYSATHGQPLRDKVSYAISKNLPVFVTEFGITAASGGFPINEEEADIWIDFLESNNISYVMWNFSRVAEPCAALNRNSLKTSGFTIDDFSQAGKWLIETIKEKS